MINFTNLIKGDEVLSHYDFDVVYIILLRLKNLGYICQCKCENEKE